MIRTVRDFVFGYVRLLRSESVISKYHAYLLLLSLPLPYLISSSKYPKMASAADLQHAHDLMSAHPLIDTHVDLPYVMRAVRESRVSILYFKNPDEESLTKVNRQKTGGDCPYGQGGICRSCGCAPYEGG